MSRWYVASSITPAADSSIQALPNPGAYTDLDDGDFCILHFNDEVVIYTYDSSSALTQEIPYTITPDGNSGNGRWIKQVQETNGFHYPEIHGTSQNNELTTMSFVDGATRELTITPVGSNYTIFVEGGMFVIDDARTIQITDAEGVHWIYFDTDGELHVQAPGGSTDDLILQKCLVAQIYWDAANNAAILLGDERHGSNMPAATHYHFHECFGAQWESGITPGSILVDESGALDTHCQLDVSDGEYHDEDLEINVENNVPQQLQGPAVMPIVYLDGANGDLRATTPTDFPVSIDGGDTLPSWNEFTGGVWQRTELGNNRFMCVHIAATNSLLTPVIAVMGQATYVSKSAAQTGAETEVLNLATGQITVEEVIFIATLIVQSGTGYGNAVKSRFVATDTGDDFIDWRGSQYGGGSGTSASDHEALLNLFGGAANDHYHLTQVQHGQLTGEIIDGSDTDLHYHNTLREVGSDNVVATSNGLDLVPTASSSTILGFLTSALGSKFQIYSDPTFTSFGLWTGAAMAGGITLWNNAQVELFYNNLKAIETNVEGMRVYDTSGSAPAIYLSDDASQDLCRLVGGGSQNNGMLTIGVHGSSNWETSAVFNDDGAVELYYNNIKELETGSGHVDITNGLKVATSTVTADDILDEDSMASNSPTALVTQQSVKAYVDGLTGSAVGQNVIINGDFDIAQRGLYGAATPSGAFISDRWEFNHNTDSTNLHTGHAAAVPTVIESGHTSQQSLYVNSVVADASMAADQYARIQYFVEGYDIINLWGKTCTLSFWTMFDDPGTMSVALRCGGFDATYVSEFSVGDGVWEKHTLTFDMDDSIGTWSYDNNIGLAISFGLASGSDYTTATLDQWQSGPDFMGSNQTNFIANASSISRFSQVKLELGSVATPFVSRSFEQELALCQRYFEKSYSPETAPGTATSTGMINNFANQTLGVGYPWTPVDFNTSKAKVPTMYIYSPNDGAVGNLYNVGAPGNKAAYGGYPSEHGFNILTNVAGAASDGQILQAHWAADAEL